MTSTIIAAVIAAGAALVAVILWKRTDRALDKLQLSMLTIAENLARVGVPEIPAALQKLAVDAHEEFFSDVRQIAQSYATPEHVNDVAAQIVKRSLPIALADPKHSESTKSVIEAHYPTNHIDDVTRQSLRTLATRYTAAKNSQAAQLATAIADQKPLRTAALVERLIEDA